MKHQGGSSSCDPATRRRCWKLRVTGSAAAAPGDRHPACCVKPQHDVRSIVWTLSKLTTQAVGTPSASGVSSVPRRAPARSSSPPRRRLARSARRRDPASGRAQAGRRPASPRTRPHRAASAQSDQSSAGPQSAIASSARSLVVGGKATQALASCSPASRTRCSRSASRSSANDRRRGVRPMATRPSHQPSRRGSSTSSYEDHMLYDDAPPRALRRRIRKNRGDDALGGTRRLVARPRRMGASPRERRRAPPVRLRGDRGARGPPARGGAARRGRARRDRGAARRDRARSGRRPRDRRGRPLARSSACSGRPGARSTPGGRGTTRSPRRSASTSATRAPRRGRRSTRSRSSRSRSPRPRRTR